MDKYHIWTLLPIAIVAFVLLGYLGLKIEDWRWRRHKQKERSRDDR